MLICRRRRRPRRGEGVHRGYVDERSGGECRADAEVGLAEKSAAAAGVDRYLVSGERVGSLLDFAWKVCVGLGVLVLIAWVLGVLPVAVKLF